jgi:predicted nucleic-acid-binding protein
MAEDMLTQAMLVALPLPALCELAWLMSSGYHTPRADIARTIRAMLAADNATTDEAAALAALAALDSGGDFADGVIAHGGRRMDGEVFVSFDRNAVALIEAQGGAARLLA